MAELVGNAKAAIQRRIPRRILWKHRPVRVCWITADDPRGNFGDQLSPAIIKRLFGVSVKSSGMGTADLISVGSMLDYAEQAVEGQRPYIWGTGFLSDGPAWAGEPVRVLALRGKLSAKRMAPFASAETALGDPGILMREAFPELDGTKRYRIGVVPHFTDFADMQAKARMLMPDAHVIDVLAPFEQVVREITACSIVLSSSLHGLIMADAYRIPSLWVTPGSGVMGGRFKFDDYYSAFGVERNPWGLAEALVEAPRAADRWVALPGFEEVQTRLIESFLLPRV